MLSITHLADELNAAPAPPAATGDAEPAMTGAVAAAACAVWQDLVQLAAQSTDAAAAALALEQPSGEVVCLARSGDAAPSLGAPVNRERGISAACLRTGQVQHCADADLDSRVDPEVCRQLGVRSVLAIPIRAAGRTVGLLSVYSERRGHFTQADIAALERLVPAAMDGISREPAIAAAEVATTAKADAPGDAIAAVEPPLFQSFQQRRSSAPRRVMVALSSLLAVVALAPPILWISRRSEASVHRVAARVQTPDAIVPPVVTPTVDAAAAQPSASQPDNTPATDVASSAHLASPAAKPAKQAQPPSAAPARTSDELVIALDPGHGGDETGAIGEHGLEEKQLVLDVALRLGDLLQSRLGANVVFTRRDDRRVALPDRAAIANGAAADFMISIHANSSDNHSVDGVETYSLATEAAATNAAALAASREFAVRMQQSLAGALGDLVPNRGVRTASLAVLRPARMPAILVEIPFVSSPREERRMSSDEYRQQIAEALFAGVRREMLATHRAPAPTTFARTASASEKPYPGAGE